MASAYAKGLLLELDARGGYLELVEPGLVVHIDRAGKRSRVQAGEFGRMCRAGLLFETNGHWRAAGETKADDAVVPKRVATRDNDDPFSEVSELEFRRWLGSADPRRKLL